MVKVLIVCVNYHSEKEIVEYIDHLCNQTVYNRLDIVVCDNSCDEVKFLLLVSKFKNIDNVFIYNPKMNLGYLHGINFGINKYLETHSLPEWIVISNTDITYGTETFYEELLLNYPNGYNCVIAPSIYARFKKEFQNPMLINRYSKLEMFVLTKVFKNRLIERSFNLGNNIRIKFIKHKKSIVDNQEIYAGHGACLILNKDFFNNGGNLNYGSFLFGEEVYIAEVVKKIGGKVYFDKRLKVNHNEHQTIGKVKSKLINKYYDDSMNYLYKKFYKDK